MKSIYFDLGELLPFESIWSIFWKIALQNHVSLRNVWDFFLKKNSHSNTVHHLCKEKFDTHRIAECTECPVETIEQGTLEYYLGDHPYETYCRLTDRGFRYCPECVKSGYHTPLFQFYFFNKCPIHDVPLTSISTLNSSYSDPRSIPNLMATLFHHVNEPTHHHGARLVKATQWLHRLRELTILKNGFPLVVKPPVHKSFLPTPEIDCALIKSLVNHQTGLQLSQGIKWVHYPVNSKTTVQKNSPNKSNLTELLYSIPIYRQVRQRIKKKYLLSHQSCVKDISRLSYVRPICGWAIARDKSFCPYALAYWAWTAYWNKTIKIGKPISYEHRLPQNIWPKKPPIDISGIHLDGFDPDIIRWWQTHMFEKSLVWSFENMVLEFSNNKNLQYPARLVTKPEINQRGTVGFWIVEPQENPLNSLSPKKGHCKQVRALVKDCASPS